MPMQKHRALSLARLKTFADTMRARLYPSRAPVTLHATRPVDRITYDAAMREVYAPASVGDRLGTDWETVWARIDYTVPDEWAGREIHLRWDSTSEACVWIGGEPRQGLTGTGYQGSKNGIRTDYLLLQRAAGGESGSLHIEVAINELFGIPANADHHQFGLLRMAEIAAFDRPLWDLLWDFVVIADMAHALPANTPRGGQALAAANAMVNTIYLDDRSTWDAGRAIAARFMAETAGGGAHRITAVGHAHIDTAWLWPLAETRRKVTRTLTTTLRLMEQYPDYKFVFSQAQQLVWMEERHPDRFRELQAQAAVGRFIPVGGTWVEPDCNIPSGESLVRQFLYGQQYFLEKFGARSREFWLPDTFGYPAALPTIMRGAGIESFLTQKLSWNQFNKPDRSTFWWEGLDGSRVLAHFPPADTYNAVGTVEEVLFSVANFKDHERARDSLTLYGWGDGGGGPTAEMIERLRRMANTDGLPRVAFDTPQTFFDRAHAIGDDLTTWTGELYFELHRGTYTTQARTKANNRRAEILMHEIEVLHVMAGIEYPKAEIDRLWKLVLLNQFHDILPGSSIGQVYRDAEADYAEIFAAGGRLRDAAIAALAPAVEPSQATHLAVINPSGVPRGSLVVAVEGLPGLQQDRFGRGLYSVDVEPYTFTRFSLNAPNDGFKEHYCEITEDEQGFTLKNDTLAAVLRRDGRLVYLAPARSNFQSSLMNDGNRFILYEDQPSNWDAWDIDAPHLEKHGAPIAAHSARIVENGSLRVAVEFQYRIGANSRLTQIVQLDYWSQILEFDQHLNWHEQHQLLKVEFETTLHADEAIYETQFGIVKRPTHYNTSYDIARFEVSAQRWMALIEPGRGLALMNDSKYGYSVHRHVMRLSLLRGATYPDPHADQGEHHFRFALRPCVGGWEEMGPVDQDMVSEAIIFNQPPITVPTAQPLETLSLLGTDWNVFRVVMDTVKRSEDGEGIIMRFYEPIGASVETRLDPTLLIASVHRCNLLEDELGAIPLREDGSIQLEVKPFEIVTLKLRLKG